MAGNDAALLAMAHGIQFPGAPEAKGAIEHRVVHVEHLVLDEPQVVLVQFASAIKPHAYVERVPGLILDLLESCKYTSS